MKRFILTGAPGSGKTSILRALAAAGYPVVEEAATDVMAARLALGQAEPWTDPRFIDRIAGLQRQRRVAPVSPDATVQVPGPGRTPPGPANVMEWGSRMRGGGQWPVG